LQMQRITRRSACNMLVTGSTLPVTPQQQGMAARALACVPSVGLIHHLIGRKELAVARLCTNTCLLCLAKQIRVLAVQHAAGVRRQLTSVSQHGNMLTVLVSQPWACVLRPFCFC
jgi:hypothetical protein